MQSPFLNNEQPTHEYNGMYRGIVVDSNDPLQAGRVKIRIYPMFKNVDDESLPWATYADPGMGGASNVGGSNIPSIGNVVWTFFEAGDFRFPVYFAGAQAMVDNVPMIPETTREGGSLETTINKSRKTNIKRASGGGWDEPKYEFKSEYPNNRVYRTNGGITIEIDDTTGNIRIHQYHPSGSRDEISNDGSSVSKRVGNSFEVNMKDKRIYVSGNYDVSVDGDVGINSNGKIVIKGASTVNVESTSTVNINGSNVRVKGSTINLN